MLRKETGMEIEDIEEAIAEFRRKNPGPKGSLRLPIDEERSCPLVRISFVKHTDLVTHVYVTYERTVGLDD